MIGYDALASVYDILANDVDVQEWLAYLQRFFPKKKTETRIADIGCGTGRYSIALAKEDYQVIGVDVSAQMLHIAAENARKAGQKIRFVQQSAIALSLPVQNVVLAICDVINHLSLPEVQAFFESAYTIIAPGGVLLFDISSAAKLYALAEDSFYFEDREDITYFWQNQLSGDKAKVEMELALFQKENDEVYRREDVSLTQYIYEEEVLKALAKEVGFTVQTFAFLQDTAPVKSTQRIQFVAQKHR